jgi:hypothetical protein
LAGTAFLAGAFAVALAVDLAAAEVRAAGFWAGLGFLAVAFLAVDGAEDLAGVFTEAFFVVAAGALEADRGVLVLAI